MIMIIYDMYGEYKKKQHINVCDSHNKDNVNKY